MDDDHKPSAEGKWEAKKSKVEAKKLEIESKNYKECLDLGDKKRRANLNNWYFQVLLSTLAAIATVFSFFLGKYSERTSDIHKAFRNGKTT